MTDHKVVSREEWQAAREELPGCRCQPARPACWSTAAASTT